ncbi:hypothetical protein [Bacillus sp. FDAARGOS_1420]|uniref:hypothetical protein n=1 Tax=unclassified Bacillus (in: firmicutes) TaxID=185979 RepID=UPI001C5BC8EB|nr:hypothetical protein [Bacillus sp. FDAARGOS_1420]MBW3493238.1 hypothetical protein [Bacillus sp. FDAARGOS_1420]
MKSYEFLITYKDDSSNWVNFKGKQSKEELQTMIVKALNDDVEFLSCSHLGVILRKSEVRSVIIGDVK